MISDPFLSGFLVALGVIVAVCLAGAAGVTAYVVAERVSDRRRARITMTELDRLEEAEAIEEAEHWLAVTRR